MTMFAEIKPEQGPPLLGPLSFFALAPIAMICAGVLLFPEPLAVTARWFPRAMAITHLGTLGFLGAVMLGALYQMLPVVAGAPVPLVRLCHVVHAALVVGIASITAGFVTGGPRGFWIGMISLGVAFVLFVIPVGYALVRAPVRTATVNGIRLAMLGLVVLVVLGAWMAYGRAGNRFSGDWGSVLYAHLGLGGVVWIGGLIAAVSFQVIPMFYLTEPFPRWSRGVVLALVSATALAIAVVVVSGGKSEWIYGAIAPGALGVWLVHPIVAVRQLAKRKRRRADESLHFWYAGLACAPVALVVALVMYRTMDVQWPVLLGWTVIWGWAGLIMHGMLTRIVPFLVWFHRYSGEVGMASVPPMRRLLPAHHARLGLVVHVLTLCCGWAAIWSREPIVVRATAIGLALTGLVLASEIGRVLLHLRADSSRL